MYYMLKDDFIAFVKATKNQKEALLEQQVTEMF